ncbi:MAG: glycosyltransferase [Propylenella sp.]
MKIALVNQAHPSFGGPGGAERSVKSLAEALARRGHDVVSLSMAPKAMTEHMSENGIHSELNISRVRTVLFGKVAARPTEPDLMAQFIARNAPDVVHTNTFWHNTELWKNVSRINIPIVHTLRELKLACSKNMFNDEENCPRICQECKLTAQLNRSRSALVTSVVGISDFILRRHLDLGFFVDATVQAVVPNAHAMGLRPASREAAPESPLRLGFLGRLHPTKGIDRLIDAVAARPDDRVRLIIAGEVQDAEISRRLARVEGDPRIEYLGFVQPAELFAECDALVVPSRWHEPFGRVVVESFAHGVPVLAAAMGGLPELIADGATGWTFDWDTGGIESGVEAVLRDRAKLPEMRAQCLEAARRYEAPRIAEEYERVYASTLAAHRARHGQGERRVARAAKPGPVHWIMSLGRQPRANRLRVLVVTGLFPKLTETFVVNHIAGLIENGVEVTILAERLGGPEEWHADVDKFGLVERCLWYGIPRSLENARSFLSRTSDDIRKEISGLLEATSVISVPPPFQDLAHALLDEQMRIAVKLRLFHAAQVLAGAGRSFDVVHCHFGHRGLLAADLARMGVLPGQIVVNFHGIDLTEHIRRHGLKVYDPLKPKCAMALPVSNLFRERLLHLGFSPAKTRVHHVGIDCARFRFAPRAAPSEGPVRLLTVGRLVEKKGLQFALRALAVHKERNPYSAVRYDIIGDGPDRKTLEQLAGKLAIADRVTFHGSMPHSEIDAWMRKAHIYVAPSVTAANGDMEGIPTTLMEAMASGLPVVASDHSGISELVSDKESGLLAPERNYKDLADRLQMLISNPEIWGEFGREGRAVVEREFNIRTQNARLVDWYRELVDARPAVERATA